MKLKLVRLARLRGFWGAVKPVRQIVLTNKAIGWYSLPKLALLGFLTVYKITRPKKAIRWLIPLTSAAELAITARQAYQRYRTGSSLRQVSRDNGLRLGLNLGVAWLQLGLFGLLFWPFALLLALLAGLVGMIGLVALNLWLLLAGMRATPAEEVSQLFEQIRMMQELETAIAKLEAQLALTRNRESRLDMRFYLGWAETYLGHRELFAPKWQAAQAYYEAALQFDATNPAARAMLVVALVQQRDFVQAVNQYAELTRLVNNEGAAKKQPLLWIRHVNETSSEYEINAGAFQLGALLYALLAQNPAKLSQSALQDLQQPILDAVASLPNRSAEELKALLQRKAGNSLGALNVLAAGPYRAPANPLEQLIKLTTLPTASGDSRAQESAA